MIKIYRQGAVGALLDEYEKALAELQQVIQDITDAELIKVVDIKTTDANCRSIQAILSHVVLSGYAYAIYIRKLWPGAAPHRDNVFHFTIKDYQKDLQDMFMFTLDTFNDIQDGDLEQSTDDRKIITSWGQVYNIEQITEHAIVHILRHRRQVEKFKIALRTAA